jgi:glycopeptide antibiotics resistance protein
MRRQVSGRRNIYLAAIACSIALILISIFPWRGFDPTGHWHRVGLIPFVSRPARVIDVVGNVILFVPLGASIALLTQRPALVLVSVVAFILSFAGEWAQVYSRYRYPNGGDLVCNVLGAVLAAYVVEQFRRRRMSRPATARGSRASEIGRQGIAVTYKAPAPPLMSDRGRAGLD